MDSDSVGKRVFKFVLLAFVGLLLLAGCNLKERPSSFNIISFDQKTFLKQGHLHSKEDGVVYYTSKETTLQKFTLMKTKGFPAQYKIDRGAELISIQPNPVRYWNVNFVEQDVVESLVLLPQHYYKKGLKIKVSDDYDMYFRRISTCGDEDRFYVVNRSNRIAKGELPTMYILEAKVSMPSNKYIKRDKILEQRQRLETEFNKINICALKDN